MFMNITKNKEENYNVTACKGEAREGKGSVASVREYEGDERDT